MSRLWTEAHSIVIVNIGNIQVKTFSEYFQIRGYLLGPISRNPSPNSEDSQPI
jgi:hypothetical protein